MQYLEKYLKVDKWKGFYVNNEKNIFVQFNSIQFFIGTEAHYVGMWC